MHIVRNVAEYQAVRKDWTGRTVALVPTMGALHEGHAALIRHARQLADRVVVSIFVNPLQFGPTEDLSRYPRPEAQDQALCRELGVDALFFPGVETMYPDGMENMVTVVPPETLTNCLCGAYRPGHFTGVATVVLKLFNILQPDLAVFGEKDAQQLMVIRRMVRDLQVPVEIAGYPTVRDGNGLALSSRNRYLKTEEEEQAALALSGILNRLREKVKQAGGLPAESTLRNTAQDVLSALGKAGELVKIQYLEAVDQETFAPVKTLNARTKVLIAAYVNDVRLIDNLDLV